MNNLAFLLNILAVILVCLFCYLVIGYYTFIIFNGEFENFRKRLSKHQRVTLNILACILWPIALVILLFKSIVEIMIYLYKDIKELS